MPALYPVFIGIGLMAGTYGFINMISAAMNQKEAGKMNGRANELLRNVSAESEMQESFF